MTDNQIPKITNGHLKINQTKDSKRTIVFT
jgi:hypothetical protein